jgi:hypothetical protein
MVKVCGYGSDKGEDENKRTNGQVGHGEGVVHGFSDF